MKKIRLNAKKNSQKKPKRIKTENNRMGSMKKILCFVILTVLLIIILLLLTISALISGSEVAYFSLTPAQLEKLKENDVLLLNNPDLILADEPTGNLDSRSGKIVIQALEDINQRLGKTIVMVTHDPQVASHCSRIIFLKDGKILKDIEKTNGQEAFYMDILEMMKEL